jgi:colanic acid biosynthesis glycosyl transferase WcaI
LECLRLRGLYRQLLKIIFLNRYFFPDHSATSQILSDLAFALAAEGRDVHVIASRQRYDEPRARLPVRGAIRGVSVHRVWTSSFGRGNLIGRTFDYLTFYISAIWRLLWLIQRGNIVIAKTDPPLLSIIVAPIAGLKGAKFVNWLQDLFPDVAEALDIGRGGMAQPGVRLLKALRNTTLRLADANVVIGDLMAERLRQVGVRETRIRVIANWADGTIITPVSCEVNPLRKAWGLDGKFVVGYSGNFGRAHEFETLLSAMRVLTGWNTRSNIAFLFIGAGAQREKLQAAISKDGFTNVQFQPYQPGDKLAESLSVADIHLVSLQPAMEGLIVPSKFYGIAAAGRATAYIGDTNGEIPRYLKQHKCGFAVAVGEGEALAQRLNELAAEPERCYEMGARARALFEREFDQKIAIGKWEQLLSEIR